jgi:hypothetical protein
MKKTLLVVLMSCFMASSFAKDSSTNLHSFKKSTPAFQSKSGYGQTRNVFAIGYQIGGFSALCFEYEFRTSDLLGINFGLGFFGLTGGLKFHTSDDKNSTFFNVSYKDGGFGQVSTLGVEVGDRLPFSKRNPDGIGFHFQIGAGKILEIDPAFENQVYKGKTAPPFTLTLGLGLSW